MKYLALDYGGTAVKYALVDDEGNLSNKGQKIAPGVSKEDFARVAVDLYKELKEEISGVAISMPGVIDTESGLAITAGAYNNTMKGVNVVDLLSRDIDVPVSIENDAKAAVAAELWKGGLCGINNGAVLIIGTALGGAFVLDGKIRKGEHFASGEASNLLMSPGKLDMTNSSALFGMAGLLLSTASAMNLDTTYFDIPMINMYKEDHIAQEDKIDGIKLFKMIEEGRQDVLSPYRSWLEGLCTVLLNIKVLLDPAKILIGGGVSRNPRFIKDLKECWIKYSAFNSAGGFIPVELEPCTFTAEANMIGAVYVWKQKYGK